MTSRFFVPLLATLTLTTILAYQPSSNTPSHLTDAFSAGWMLQDTNGDGIVDFIKGNIVVPAHSSAVENAAAANLAARLAFNTTGLTPPLVISAAEDSGDGARIWIGKDAVPQNAAAQAARYLQRLQPNEGGIFSINGNLAVLGHDDAGLLAASDAYSARCPYIWKVPGDRLSSIGDELNHASPSAKAQLVGVTYVKGKAGIARVFLETAAAISAADLKAALSSSHLAAVHELVIVGRGPDLSALNSKPLPPIPAIPGAAAIAASATGSTAPTPPPAAGPANPAETEAATPQPLDLSTLYTSKGLFKGSAKMPIPSSLDGQLYVPAGATGIAMANLASRMGLESTGLTLPLARPATEVLPKDVRTKAVVSEDSPLSKDALQKLNAEETAGALAETPLSAGEGELRIVDHAFNKQAAVLIRGDQLGSASALHVLTDRFPNLWETGKQYASLEELRYDLHRFFSLRSGAGQAAVSLYHLNRWIEEINESPSNAVHDVKAEMYVDIADPQLESFVRNQVQAQLHTSQAEIKVGSLHAGTQCCAQDPELHYEEPGYAFHQAPPTFAEDITIPWEGTRLLDVVRDALHDVKRDQTVTLVARVSEGPEVRKKLQTQLTEMLAQHGINSGRAKVVVLCAYKQGYSWLMDEFAPELEGKPVARVNIEFAKDTDPTGVRVMYSPARWVQELYPVDEMLAKKLNIPLDKIQLNEFEPTSGSPTYRVRAYDANGAQISAADFNVATTMRPYNGVMPRYEQVQVETGWVRLEAGTNVILDQRIKTDIEEFWDHYQDESLPKIFHYVMAQAKGDLRPEFAPPFDTLRIDIHMSEPDYAIGLDKERISTLEALQEDTFYSTENFVDMMGNLEAGRPINYVGRIIPVVHASEDGKDGHVHIDFYGKPAANPLVRLSWTDAQGQHHEKNATSPS